MNPIASPLASLPPAPQLMPGGVAGVPGAQPAAIPSTQVATQATAPATTPAGATAGDDVGTGNPGNPGNPGNGRQGVASDDGRGSAAEQRMIAELKARDREVRDHENAHRAAAGDLVRGGSYTYQQGPDGKRYAVGGDVQIDSSPVPDDPEATAEKMARVIAAALAPAEPSSTDLAVAAQATAEQNRARVEASRQETDGPDSRSGEAADPGTSAYREVANQARPESLGLQLEA